MMFSTGYSLHIAGGTQNLVYNNLSQYRFCYSSKHLKENTSYSWFFTAFDPQAQVPYGASLNFTGANIPPTAPVGVVPVNASSLDTRVAQIFKWFKSQDDNLTGYSLHDGGTNLVYNSLT